MDRLKPVSSRLYATALSNLHSNMDRLKPPTETDNEPAGEHLHSNMDRLKPVDICSRVFERLIYIPIWID